MTDPIDWSVVHSTLQDSVMNYERTNLYDKSKTPKQRILQMEDDCAPFPWDILAIYAIYQNR